ncbi:unnamed protein product (macronuclear) [Paramecium tetraurelia]|uniref:PX domain-containing protein n=1 Tax=Paramecium tetraurelia TaxID=5888 RepID=A0CXA5_PARTE|nr:uncharacterized protein GSPATT00011054001 [Paramecium tetraurelia]CAK75422.1 unnamed protein product [Paramecium tetraurelia]|eukprot:XP_001442819.1 hypothetical protein (macronuclear) [Paramecium tetraurelia strain d4-2]
MLSQSFVQEVLPTLFRVQSERPNPDQKQQVQKERQGKDLYSLIVDQQMIKAIEIIETFKEEDHGSIYKKHIVNYVIQIKTDYFDYTIPKRYSEFEKLHEQLHSQLKTMPKFPQKTLIQTNSRKIIAQRQALLQQFLQHLLQNLDHTMYIFLEFLNIKEQFQKGGFDQNVKLYHFSKEENALRDLVDTSPKKIQPKNEPEQMIIHYLIKLNEKIDERGKIFQKMEKYCFGKIQQVSSTMLKVLFTGDDERELKGIIQALSIQNNDIQSHISCIMGFQFFRKVLEYDYNPNAEQALKQFGEISIKQFKKIMIQSHICGQQKLCKQDALILLHKYINQNQLKDQMIKYLIDDNECLQEYEQFLKTHVNKNIDEVKVTIESTENLQEPLQTKSNSSENSILEQEATIEQLYEISQMNLNWKLVQEFDNHLMYHLSGQYVKTVHPLICSIERAITIFTDLKIQWFHGMIQKDVLEEYDQFRSLIVEYYVWEDKSTFKKMAFVSEQEIQKIDDFLYQITIIPSTKPLPANYKIKCDQKGQKMSLMFLKKITDNSAEAIVYQNIMDKTFRTALTPVILKEIPWFNHTITKLKALL